MMKLSQAHEKYMEAKLKYLELKNNNLGGGNLTEWYNQKKKDYYKQQELNKVKEQAEKSRIESNKQKEKICNEIKDEKLCNQNSNKGCKYTKNIISSKCIFDENTYKKTNK